MADDPLIKLLVEALRPTIRAEVAAVLGTGIETVYRSDLLPFNTGRETFNKKCSTIDGARKVPGRGKGLWEIPRSLWHQATRPKRPVVAPPVEAAQTDEERADAWIAESARATKVAR